MNELYVGELRLWLNLFLPSVKLLKKVRVGSKVRRVYDPPRTPFERVQACRQANLEQVARLEQLRKSLDPFQLGRSIERKLARIARLAHRRLSPQAVQPLQPQAAPQARRPNGCGKAARQKRGLGNPTNDAGFPLSHSRSNNKPSVTFQMSRQQVLRLHS
jgi:hypothetical protein